MAEEGVNATVCGREKKIETFKKRLFHLFKEDFFWKDSYCEKWNFKRLSVRIKKEIINMGLAVPPLKKDSFYLSPEDWENKLKSKTHQILDVRNTYEIALGHFQGAEDLGLRSFQEFSKKLEAGPLDKNKETLIYCTGGIRCEKAISVMRNQGFKSVYQLKGGILNYLKKYPHSQFKRDCFVFDHRVSLNQNLKPAGKHSLCPHCGQPGDLQIVCKHCDRPCKICRLCKKPFHKTCSKNCAYHFKAGHICRKKYSKISFGA